MLCHVSALKQILTDEVLFAHDAKHTQNEHDWQPVSEKVMPESLRGAVEQASNATAGAISLCISIADRSLTEVQKKAYELGNHTRKEVDLLLSEVNKGAKLKTFISSANRTLDVFLRFFIPIVVTSNASNNAVTRVLNAAGFLHLSQELISYTTPANKALNATLFQAIQLQRLIQDIDRKTKGPDVNITPAIDRDLKTMHKNLLETTTLLSTKCNENMLRGYEILIDHFGATVDGVLPPKSLQQINQNLKAIKPHVVAYGKDLLVPINLISNAFTEATARIRAAAFPVGEAYASNIAGINFFVFVACMCRSWFML